MKTASKRNRPLEDIMSELEKLQKHIQDSGQKPQETADALVALDIWKPKLYGIDESVNEEEVEKPRTVDKNSDAYVVGQVFDLHKLKEYDRATWLYDHMDKICRWYFTMDKVRSNQGGTDVIGNNLLMDMTTSKVVDAIKLVSESIDKDYNFPIEAVALMSRILDYAGRDDSVDDSVFEKIYSAGVGILKAHQRLEDFMSSTKIGKLGNEPLAIDLLFEVPSIRVINYDPNLLTPVSVRKVITLLIGTCESVDKNGIQRYNPFPFSMKDVMDILENLYSTQQDKRLLHRVARTIILEPSTSLAGLNEVQTDALEIIIDAALEIIETSSETETTTTLMYYCKSRQYADKNGSDFERLIEIRDLELKDFPNIQRAVKSINETQPNLAYYLK